MENTPFAQAVDYTHRANPYPFYAQLRQTPVSRQPDGTYVVSTYREIVALLHDPRVSSDLRRLPPAAAGPAAAGPQEPSMIFVDPPDHDRMRRLAMRQFGPPHTPDLVAGMEPEVRRMVAGLIDSFAGKSRIDVVSELAFPLPVNVICKILGVPPEDLVRLHTWVEAMINRFDVNPNAPPEEHRARLEAGGRGAQELGQYLKELMERLARTPGEGMLSALAHDDGPEGRLSPGELVSNAMLLLIAGHETTVNLISHSVLSLLRHPEALELLRRRPELIAGAIEEMLRYEPPVQLLPQRSALDDIAIAGTTIPKGATIVLVLGSGNRDPDRFPNPDVLDIERRDNQHLGFGHGIHACFGAPLARLEAQIAVGEFVRRVQNPRLVVDPPPYRQSEVLRGPRQLLLEIDEVRA
jgi:cytochrome P450